MNLDVFSNIARNIYYSEERGTLALTTNILTLKNEIENLISGTGNTQSAGLAAAAVISSFVELLNGNGRLSKSVNLFGLHENIRVAHSEYNQNGVISPQTWANLTSSVFSVVSAATEYLGRTRHPAFFIAAALADVISELSKYVALNVASAEQLKREIEQDYKNQLDVIRSQLEGREQEVVARFENIIRGEAALLGVDVNSALSTDLAGDVRLSIQRFNDEINDQINKVLTLNSSKRLDHIEELANSYIGSFNMFTGGFGDGGKVSRELLGLLGNEVRDSREILFELAEEKFRSEINEQNTRQNITDFVNQAQVAIGQAQLKNINASASLSTWKSDFLSALADERNRIIDELVTAKAQLLNRLVPYTDELDEDIVKQLSDKIQALEAEYERIESQEISTQLVENVYKDLAEQVVVERKAYMENVAEMHVESTGYLQNKAQDLVNILTQKGKDVPGSLIGRLGEITPYVSSLLQRSTDAVGNILDSYLNSLGDFSQFISNVQNLLNSETERLQGEFESINSELQGIISELESLLEEDEEDDEEDEEDDDEENEEDNDKDKDGIPDDEDPDDNNNGIPDDEEEGSQGGEGGELGNPAEEGSNNANRRRRIDPLVFDLDGDGLEFIGLDQSNARFDLTGDGFATRTSWLSGDDGFLALDLNQDGKINDISELFGSGSQTGFEELSQYDSNNDGVINSQDTIFKDLLIWRDENGDGKSSKSELKNIAEYGISEISLTRTSVNSETNDTIIDEQGTYTTTNAEGEQTTHILGDVQFSVLPTYSTYSGEVTLTEQAKATNNIKGYGLMPELQVAMSLDADFAAVVASTLDGLTSENIFERFDNLLIHWANADGITVQNIDATPNLVADENGMVHFAQAGVSLSLGQLGVIKAYTGIDNLEIADGTWIADNGEQRTTGQLYQEAWNNIRNNLLIKFAVTQGLTTDLMHALSYNYDTDNLQAPFDIQSSAEGVLQQALNQAGTLDTAKEAADLVLLLNVINAFEGGFSEAHKEKVLLALLTSTSEANEWLINHINSVQSLYPNFLIGEDVTGTNASEYILGTDSDNVINTGAGNDIVYAGEGNDTVTTQGGNDIVYGESGDDVLTNNYHDSTVTLDGGEGSDALYGYYQANNTLIGGDGDDKLIISDSSSSYTKDYVNTFEGGKGNDTITGAHSRDTYRYNLGDGHDVIRDNGQYSLSDTEDKIVFGADITQEMLSFTHNSSGHLLITVTDPNNADNNGSITLEYAYINSHYLIERIEFADGSSMDTAAILAASETMYGTDGDDTLSGTSKRDVIKAGAGNDTVRTQGGNDTVYGEAGDDVLYNTSRNTNVTLDGGEGSDALYGYYQANNTLIGGDGDDKLIISDSSSSYTKDYVNTFEGGKGNDTITGAHSRDTYRYNLGDGHDVIRDNGQYSLSDTEDKIVFGADITQEMLSFTRAFKILCQPKF